jgi:hypothetical protein
LRRLAVALEVFDQFALFGYIKCVGHPRAPSRYLPVAKLTPQLWREFVILVCHRLGCARRGFAQQGAFPQQP